MRTDDLAAIPLRELLMRHPQLSEVTDEVVLGCANQAGEDNRNLARMALLLAGYPASIPGITVNRLCASGLDATIIAGRMIASGEADVVIAGGAESMTRAPFVLPKTTTAYSREACIEDTTIGWRFVNERMQDSHGTDSMPETAENVAAEYKISREDQDAFSLRSQQRVAKSGPLLAEEIIPVTITRRKGEPLVVCQDEHPRPSTTLEQLAKLPTLFRRGGSVTAGNASGINDGAAALLVASEAAMERHGWEPLARITGGASAGVAPRTMGMGPVDAVNKLCARLGHQVTDFDVIELNEAFASQALAVLRELSLPDDADFVNPNGGAIALGHPLGMSGARLAGTAALELKRRQGKLALATMCVGVGQGVAVALAKP